MLGLWALALIFPYDASFWITSYPNRRRSSAIGPLIQMIVHPTLPPFGQSPSNLLSNVTWWLVLALGGSGYLGVAGWH